MFSLNTRKTRTKGGKGWGSRGKHRPPWWAVRSECTDRRLSRGFSRAAVLAYLPPSSPPSPSSSYALWRAARQRWAAACSTCSRRSHQCCCRSSASVGCLRSRCSPSQSTPSPRPRWPPAPRAICSAPPPKRAGRGLDCSRWSPPFAEATSPTSPAPSWSLESRAYI